MNRQASNDPLRQQATEDLLRVSCLYSCDVMHKRMWPKHHEFSYKVFMFYLDLDEVDVADRTLTLFSKNRFNWFSFFDKDFFVYDQSSTKKPIKPRLADFLQTKGISWKGRATLLTNVRTFGYVFNPISFYFCFDESDKPLCALAEVTNTHKERKLYLIDHTCLSNDTFRLRTIKHFYVSPFSDLDTEFEFIFRIPSQSMQMRVDDYKQGNRILLSDLRGSRKELTDVNLLLYGLKFPLITLKVIFLIYWQALKLRLKGLPFWNKNENVGLQKDFVTTTNT